MSRLDLVVQAVCKTVASRTEGSIPSRLTHKHMARCDVWFCNQPLKLVDAGSIPVRVTFTLRAGGYGTYLHMNEQPDSDSVRVIRKTLQAGWYRADFHTVGRPVRFRGLQLAGGPVPS